MYEEKNSFFSSNFVFWNSLDVSALWTENPAEMFFSYPPQHKNCLIFEASIFQSHAWYQIIMLIIFAVLCTVSQYLHQILSTLRAILQLKPPYCLYQWEWCWCPNWLTIDASCVILKKYSFDLASICFSSGWLGALQLKRRNAKDQQMGDISSVDQVWRGHSTVCA